MIQTDRMKTIIDCVPKSHTVADIGADHGYVSASLIEKGIAKYVIASDISPNSLKKTQGLIRQRGLEDYIATRMGYGLSVLAEHEADTAIIAGLGGVLISEILDRDIHIAKTIDTFILQPMQWVRPLREYLFNNGYKIDDERLVYEGEDKYYVIMKVTHGYVEISDDMYYYLGEKLIKNRCNLLLGYILHKIKLREHVLKGLAKSKDKKEIKLKKTRLEGEVIRLKEVFDEVSKD
ncbi:MAG: SAM-dependent methyltransferase [Clostridiales bacterium]|nr:SAM-dependent methyltransferase [Clostridiales bacterium]